jgi:hypothetical protein
MVTGPQSLHQITPKTSPPQCRRWPRARLRPKRCPCRWTPGRNSYATPLTSDLGRQRPTFLAVFLTPSTAMLLAGAQHPSGVYTVESLAKFLGEVGSDGRPHAGFRAMFGALELLSEGYLTEAQIKGSTSKVSVPLAECIPPARIR